MNVKKGEEVVLAGYPGKGRVGSNQHDTNSELFCLLTLVKSVSERNISCVFRRDDLIDIPGSGLTSKGKELGGLSGGPLFGLAQKNGCWAWSLAGVLRANNLQLERLLATPAHVILADGSLRKRRAR